MKYEEGMKQVCNLIHLVNSTPIDSIKRTDRLIGDLKMDSIELIDFFLRLENINVFLKEEQINNQLIVDDIVNMVLMANNE
ncbi:acyl carrier protein [Salmonella enterica]|nr:acyl carrier protein [Salmonella enterica]